MRADLERFQEALGHQFADPALLRRALSHSSHAHEHTTPGTEPLADNEQLEFLGDSVLGFVISEELVARFPSYSEGKLSKLRAHLVSANHLYKTAVHLSLGEYLLLGRGEEMTGGRTKKTLLANALEALIAAVYLDGGLDAARRFVHRFVLHDGGVRDSVDEILEKPLTDFKSALQELAQSRRLPAPHYVIVHEEGPHHEKTFTVEVRVGRSWVARGNGLSKKSAAQHAARLLLERVQREDSGA